MFNFLNPAVLFALAAGFIPLIIHLLNRRKKKEIRFSTVHFLKQMARKEMRRLKIRQILLLITRTLIIILLVLAFARPTLRSSSNFISGRSASEVVVILDNSLSMNSLELSGNLLEKLRQRWLLLESAFRGGDRLTVLLGVQPVRVLSRRQPYSANLWEKITKEIEPGYSAGNLDGAVMQAAAVFRESNLYNKELYILSDFQQNGFSNEAQDELQEKLPGKLKIYCLPVFHSGEENLSVDSAAVVNRLVEKNQEIKIQGVVRNQHKNTYLTSLISLLIQGKRVSQKNLNLGPQESEAVDFQTTLQADGFVGGFVECESDALLEDNRYYFNFFVPDNIRLLHLAANSLGDSYVPFILKPAIEQHIFQYEKKHINEWPGVDFLNYRAVILEGVNRIPQALANRLRQFVQRGNGLLIIPGENLVPSGMNGFLRDIGMGQFLSREGRPGRSGEFVTMGAVNWQHPLFEGLFENRKTLNPITFNAFYRIKPAAGNEVIIRLKNGRPLLVGGGQDAANTYLLATALQPEWTNLVERGFVVPLFYRLLYYAATRSVRDRMEIRVGEEFSETFRMLQPPYEFSLRRPSGVTEKIVPVFKGSDVLLQVKKNPEPGNYEILQGNKVLAIYSVNHSPLESRQDFLTANDLSGFLPEFYWIPENENLILEIEQTRYGRELWPYFLGAVLLLLLLEMVLAYTGSTRQYQEELAGA